MNNNTSSNSPVLFSDGGVLNSGKIKIQGTSGKNYNLDNFTTVSSCPFPVGFGGFFQIDPNSIYAGTKWEQKKDVFILAAGDTYAAGATGGEAQHNLTVDEMPGHHHEEKIGDQSEPQGVNVLKRKIKNGTNSGAVVEAIWKSTGLGESVMTNYSGGSQPHNNMPPYYTMPF